MSKTKKDMSNMYDYFLHFNHLTGYWYAIPRDKVAEYMNKTVDDEEILKNKDERVLINYICKL